LVSVLRMERVKPFIGWKMTNKEVIALLLNLPADSQVYVSDCRSGETDRVDSIREEISTIFDSGNVLEETAPTIIVLTIG
jgi:hypothetical protein